MGFDGPFQPGEHVGGPHRTIRAQDVALTGELIEDGQHLECSAAHGGIAHKVPRPDMSAPGGLGGQTGGDALAHEPTARGWHSQPVGTT